MYKINVLFCGQIRNPQLLYKSLFKLSTKKYIEKIYLSTWNDEVNESLKLFSTINPKFKFVSEKDWIRMNDTGKVDSKIVYKSTECSTTTECDNLNCEKRKDEILNRYPITYYCEGDSRNQRDIGTGHMCKSGERKGMITQYYDETKMCFKDEKGNIYGRKFALKECGVGNTEEYNGYKNIFGGDCYALISDGKSGKGNRAIIGDNKVYTSNAN